MKLKIRGEFIYNEDGAIVGTLSDSSNLEVEIAIEGGSEALVAITKFVEDTKKGSLKAKKTFDMFKAILDKYEIAYV